TQTFQTRPSIGMYPNGDFVVAWDESYIGGPGGAYWRAFGPNASPLSPAVRADANGPDAFMGAIAADEHGDFFITWGQSSPNTGEVFALGGTRTGQVLAGPMQVNSYLPDQQSSSSVSLNAAGDGVIAWRSLSQDGSDFGVYAQRFLGPNPRVGQFSINN